jgi:hypothetical protein
MHDELYTSATLLIEYGVDVRVVMAVLAHSDPRATMRYAHASNPLLKDAAARMGQRLWRPDQSTSATGRATGKRRGRHSNGGAPWSQRSPLGESNPRPTHYELLRGPSANVRASPLCRWPDRTDGYGRHGRQWTETEIETVRSLRSATSSA